MNVFIETLTNHNEFFDEVKSIICKRKNLIKKALFDKRKNLMKKIILFNERNTLVKKKVFFYN